VPLWQRKEVQEVLWTVSEYGRLAEGRFCSVDGQDVVRGELVHDPGDGGIAQVDWSTQDVWEAYPAAGRILFVFVVLMHQRQQIVHVNVTNVTEHPTATWAGQQLI
jgi:hypothetical protein